MITVNVPVTGNEEEGRYRPCCTSPPPPPVPVPGHPHHGLGLAATEQGSSGDQDTLTLTLQPPLHCPLLLLLPGVEEVGGGQFELGHILITTQHDTSLV